MNIPQKQKPPYLKTINLGYKYRLYPTKEQEQILDYHMFVYNQAYNICLNLWLKDREKNKALNKEKITYRKAVSYDRVVKRALKFRKIKYSTVVTQQARINFLRAVKKAFSNENKTLRLKAIKNAQTPKEKVKAYNLYMPKFHSSKDIKQSFNWNNQGYQILDDDNPKFKILKILKTKIRFRYHRELPKEYKLSSITISKDSTGYYVSFGIKFKNKIDLAVSSDNLDISKSIGIDLNAYNIAISTPVNNIFKKRHNNQISISNDHLIDNGAKDRKNIRYSDFIKILERKQSRRVLKAKRFKSKLGKNFQKTQRKINKRVNKIVNKKKDLYHKISKTLTDEFDMIVVEDLKVKNMSKSAKGNEINHGKMVKQKSALNRAILNASFYQLISMLEYKQTMLNDKLFVKVNPAYSSIECSRCGNRDKANRPKQDSFRCTKCGYITNPDIQASKTILKRGLESFGVGTTLMDLKQKAFRSVSLETVS